MKKFIEESWLVLMMGVVFALLLAGTQSALQEKIKENEGAKLVGAIGEVVAGTDKTEKIDLSDKDIDNEIFKCFDEAGTHVGWAVKGNGGGFVDKIDLVVGLSPDRSKILGIKVIKQLETPGLGNKIESVPEWYGQYEGFTTDVEIEVKKGGADPAKNQINAITGATFSSRFVTDIVNGICKNVVPELEGK